MAAPSTSRSPSGASPGGWAGPPRSRRISTCPRERIRIFCGVAPGSGRACTSTPASVSSSRSRAPPVSAARAVTSATRQCPAASRAASPAPPGRSVTDSSSSTGAGASGAIRWTDPSTSRSSSVSPTTTSNGLSTMVPSGSPPSTRGSVRSTYSHITCTETRCSSWTTCDSGDGQRSTSSQASPTGEGPGPTIAQVRIPQPRAASTAATRLGLRPLVDITSSTSPGRPWARTCRAKTSSKP